MPGLILNPSAQVRVVHQGDGTVRVRVTAESEEVGKQILEKLK